VPEAFRPIRVASLNQFEQHQGGEGTRGEHDDGGDTDRNGRRDDRCGSEKGTRNECGEKPLDAAERSELLCNRRVQTDDSGPDDVQRNDDEKRECGDTYQQKECV
jgi:hypothetical protein